MPAGASDIHAAGSSTAAISRDGSGMQPFLHDLVSLVCAPAFMLSGADGSVSGRGAEGFFIHDRRAISLIDVEVADAVIAPISSQTVGATCARFVSVLRGLGDPGPDPTVTLTRTRRLDNNSIVESFTVTSRAHRIVLLRLRIRIGSDFAGIADVKRGRLRPAVQSVATESGLSFVGPSSLTVDVDCQPAPKRPATSDGVMEWTAELRTGESFTICVTVVVDLHGAVHAVAAPIDRAAVPSVRVEADDRRISMLVEQACADLRGLLLGDPASPGDSFLAAGSPWFLTLFGRDSLIAARMLLPVSRSVAAGTLRALGRRQGSRVDAMTAQAPGKVLHELRDTPVDHGDVSHPGLDRPLQLPPVYFGSVDSTPLWISLLHDAWMWGLAPTEVVDLLAPLRKALAWLGDFALDERGFVSYLDESGSGIINQGWKDSGDSIQFHNGSLAVAPIALCEVQGYAYAAAVQGAALLEAFAGGDGTNAGEDRLQAGSWRDWAARLKSRFRSAFWIDDDQGAFPAVALDRSGTRVDSVTSNIAHLLGTGLLDAEEEQRVVARLSRGDMTCRYGLRTMSSASAGFNPYSYHGGSVWTHDTAIAIAGLAGVGTPAADDLAHALIEGLLETASRFDYRLPELFAVEAQNAGVTSIPIAYPASCRPQAWSAASAIVILASILGLETGGAPVRRLRNSAMTRFGSVAMQIGDPG